MSYFVICLFYCLLGRYGYICITSNAIKWIVYGYNYLSTFQFPLLCLRIYIFSGRVLFETFLKFDIITIETVHNTISDSLLPMYRHNIPSVLSAFT